MQMEDAFLEHKVEVSLTLWMQLPHWWQYVHVPKLEE
jgi:hypothetical protein